jgi:AraC family transcriptional regulator
MITTLSQGNFFGQVLSSRQVAEFFLNETAYVPGAMIPRHSHENAYFCLVRQGSYTESYGEKTRACGPLTFAFHPPGELHSEHFGDTQARSFNIEIASDWIGRLHDCSLRLDAPVAFAPGAITDLALRLYGEFQLMDSVSQLAIEGLILEIIAGATRSAQQARPPEPPRWLCQVREILHDRFTEGLALSSIAELVGVHPVHMATVFRRHYRCTVGEYVRKLRLEYACRELALSERSLAEIAAAAGFADQSHFSRAFKTSIGISPGEYRRLRLN